MTPIDPHTPPNDPSDPPQPPTSPGRASADGGLPLCASDALEEKGKAHTFDVLHFRQSATAFALRFEGQVVAYLNRCAHVPTEMDWQEGEFLDRDKRYIICSIHGAVYHPMDGRCVTGMCGRIGLTRLDVQEKDGQVYWYPSRDTRPAFED